MKKTISALLVAAATCMGIPFGVSAQTPAALQLNTVNVQKLKMKWPEKGTMAQRDSLIAIYNDNVIKKNDMILSHREYAHWFTADNKDYLVIEEYKDFASMEKSFELNTELEKKMWPDEKKRKEFMDAMNAYFEDWHGDMVFRSNPKLSKN